MLDQVEQNWQRLLITDLVGDVDGRTFKVLSHAYLTDTFCDRVAFCRQLTSSKPIVEGGAHWIAECDLHIGIAFLEGARNSTQSAATTDGAGEAVDLSVSLLPNFRASRAIVAIAVGDVVELICPECPVWLLRGQLLSEATR